MSNAEQERIEKAWEEAEIPIDCVLGENKWAVMKNGFRYGFLAGRADAMELPEVELDQLEQGKIYIAQWDNKTADNWTIIKVTHKAIGVVSDLEDGRCYVEHFSSFRGPLRVGEGE